MFVNVIAVKMASKLQHEHETDVEEDEAPASLRKRRNG